MSTRKNTGAAQPRPAGSSRPEQAPQAVADFTRQQLAMSAEALSVILSAAANMQQVQQQFAERTAQRQHEAAQRLRTSTNPADVMGVQFDLLTSGMQDAAQYWQQLVAASSRTQEVAAAAAAPVQEQGLTAASALGPMMQAWQSMFAPLNGAGRSATTH